MAPIRNGERNKIINFGVRDGIVYGAVVTGGELLLLFFKYIRDSCKLFQLILIMFFKIFPISIPAIHQSH